MSQSVPPPAPVGSGGLANIWITFQNLVQSVNTIATTLKGVFPLATGTAGSATAGSATLPANPVGFVEVYVPSLGSTVKVPYYNT